MRARWLIPAVSALALALTPAALAGSGGLGPVTPASPNAEGINTTYWIITGFAVAIFLLVETTLIAFIVKYRRGNRARHADGDQIHGSSRLETIWTIGPVAIVFVIFAVVLIKLPGIADVPPAGAEGGPLDVRVSANQFYWQYTYPNGVVSIDRLRAPVGVPVRLTLTTPDHDVIHSWWVPALGGKIDAIPGHTTRTWFRADRAGVFKGRCAELCGIQHARMVTFVEAMDKDAFDAWYAEQDDAQSRADLALGEQEWVGVCAKCHGLAGEGDYGPPVQGGALTDAERITTTIRKGKGRMPAVASEWTTAQVDSLNAYLKELAAGGS